MSKKQDTTGGTRCRRPVMVTCVLSGFLLATSMVAAVGQANAAGGFGVGLPPAMTAVQSQVRPSTASGLPDLRSFAPRLQSVQLANLSVAMPNPEQHRGYDLAALGDADGGSPRVSGLAWRSGASCSQYGFTSWRGRALDVYVGFVEHATWDRMFQHLRSNWFKGVVQRSPQPVVSMPMMPHSAKRQHGACAAGQFDSNFRQFGQLLTQAGAGRAIVRLGWEAGIGSDSHPWGIDSAGVIPVYQKCFQRLARALKQGGPGLKIEWTNSKKGGLSVPIMRSYPGDDVVDVFGVHYYDNIPKLDSERAWSGMYSATKGEGAPLGIGAWLKEAQKHGKKLAVPEWGVAAVGGDGPSKTDNPIYIDMMHRFFRSNSNAIAYESYFNCNTRHELYPSRAYPRASSRYKSLWSAG